VPDAIPWHRRTIEDGNDPRVITCKTIEPERESDCPAGQRIARRFTSSGRAPGLAVTVRRLTLADKSGKFCDQGDAVLFDALFNWWTGSLATMISGSTYPNSRRRDLEAFRPTIPRVFQRDERSFGGWAEDAKELERIPRLTRQQRKLRRRSEH